MLWILLIGILSTAKSVNISFVLVTINSPMKLVSIIDSFFRITADVLLLIPITECEFINYNNFYLFHILHNMYSETSFHFSSNERSICFSSIFLFTLHVFLSCFFLLYLPFNDTWFCYKFCHTFLLDCGWNLWRKKMYGGSMNGSMSFMHMVYFFHF